MVQKFCLNTENNQNWKLTEINKDIFLSDEFNKNIIDKLTPKYEAKIPGNVRLDLVKAGVIPNPYFGLDNEKSLWVSDRYWMYQLEFEVPESMEGKDIFLIFTRTDYYASFFIDQNHLGRHVGMFSPSVFNITKFLEKNSEEKASLGENKRKHILSVMLACSPPKRWRAVKCQMSYHWDFAPKIVTIGIWDDVEIISVNGVRIEDYFFFSTIPKIQGSFGYDILLDAELIVEKLVDNALTETKKINTEISNDHEVIITIKIPELNVKHSSNFALTSGKNKCNIAIPINKAELWYPNGSGEQKLYSIDIEISRGPSDLNGSKENKEISDKKSVILDKKTGILFGFRKIGMKYNPKTMSGNEKWTFVINNRIEFIRGANWVPPDSLFGRINKETYKNLIDMAKAVNMNMFRVWGGGICEKQAFYELCDKAGIMLWHEFPFACSNYPNDNRFLNIVEKECSSIVKQIRNHCSVIAYVGGNEWNPEFNKHLVKTLERCAAIDPTRIFYSVSPCKGDLHDWAVWHTKRDFGAYKVGKRENYNLFQFFSEFGLQSCPTEETLRKFIPEGKLWPPNEYHKYHHAELGKLRRYGECVCKIKDLRSFIYGTQIAQAEGMKYGIEYCRRQKPEMSGVLFWQLNEPWPTICWSIIDHEGTPKMAYNYLKEIYNPVLTSLDYKFSKEKNQRLIIFDVYAINDSHQNIQNATITVGFFQRDKKINSIEFKMEILKESSKKVNNSGMIAWEIPQNINIAVKSALNIKCKVLDSDKNCLSVNNYYPFRYRERQKVPQFINELSALGAWYFNEKFWFIYELGRLTGTDNL